MLLIICMNLRGGGVGSGVLYSIDFEKINIWLLFPN